MMNFKGELIGLTVEVVGSKNKTLLGLKGRVIDETRNTITIQGEKSKKILKSHVTLKIDGKLIGGKAIQKRPEDRIK